MFIDVHLQTSHIEVQASHTHNQHRSNHRKLIHLTPGIQTCQKFVRPNTTINIEHYFRDMNNIDKQESTASIRHKHPSKDHLSSPPELKAEGFQTCKNF